MQSEDQTILNEDQGLAGLCVLGMLKDLFADSPIQSFSRNEVVDFIHAFMSYKDLFSLESRLRYSIVDAELALSAQPMQGAAVN